MRYVSTRGGVSPTSLSDALAAGLAPDAGLYVPESIPVRDPATAPEGDLADTCAWLLAPFFAGDPLADDLPTICREALDFPVPRVPLGEDGASLLELFHGPTAAFKDVGARFLAACLSRLPRSDARPLTILVATSGDTGAAVAGAFHRRDGFEVVILYPDGRVSNRQAHQLGAFGDNVRAFAVAGAFDDCQRLVKQAFADTALRQRRPLGSANSISLGRLLPQMSYYAHAALAHWRQTGQALDFIVPTGNLGNAFACLLARACGLPIGRVVLATNANRTLPEWLEGGEYRARPSLATLANAMDVGDPSNAERLAWLLPTPEARREAVSAQWVDDDTIRATIRRVAVDTGQALCPHSACAAAVLKRLREAGDTRAWCLAATAHPAKFESIVEPLLGRAVPVPPALQALLDRPSSATPLAADYGTLAAALAI
jgi:threonine synthase